MCTRVLTIQITWAEQQTVKVREKRDLTSLPRSGAGPAEPERRRDLSAASFPANIPPANFRQQPANSDETNYFNDPLWATQWYLVCLRVK